MEGASDNYPFVRKDHIVTTGEVMFSLVDTRTGDVLADWFEKQNENSWENFNSSVLDQGHMKDNFNEGKCDPFSIYISKLDPYTTTEDLVQHFGAFGVINRVTLLRSKSTGMPKGAAYMQFSEKVASQRALFLDGSSLRGFSISVQRKLLYDAEANLIKAQPDEEPDKEVGVDPLSIYVGNLGLNVTSQHLAAHFDMAGEITKVSVLKKKKHRNSGGAFIQFRDQDAVENALFMNDTNLFGKLIKVERKRAYVGKQRIQESSLEENVSEANDVHDSYSIYVGNVDIETKEEELGKLFDIAGEVVGVTLMKEKCAALVQFKDHWSVEGALCMAGSRLRGKELKIWRKRKLGH